MKNFIEADILLKRTKELILDVRRGTATVSGRALYHREHVEGAHYLDLEADLSGKVTELTGAHPLPELTVFQEKLREMGATNDTEFLIYDDGDQFVAARAWFVLKYYGIKSVRIINGGFPAIKKIGVSLTSTMPSSEIGTITLVPQEQLIVDFEMVKDFSENGKDNTVLIDARSKARYLGQSETLYEKAGHIPRAQSYFYREVLTEDYQLKPLKELETYFKSVMDQEVIVSCGSGITAAMIMIALDELGKSAKIYPGSYSEWIKRGQPVVEMDETYAVERGISYRSRITKQG